VSSGDAVTALIQRLTREVADELSDHATARTEALTRDDERTYAHVLINAALEREARARLRDSRHPYDTATELAIARAVHDRLFGLGRLQQFLDDDEISDVAVNGCDHVFVTYRDGRRQRGEPVADSDGELIELIRLAAARMGRTERRFDAAEPELNMQLPDGSRLHAIRDVSGRPCVSIRRHRFALSFLDELVERAMLSAQLADFLRTAVRARKNLVVCGSTGAGKPTHRLWHTSLHERNDCSEIPAHQRRPRGSGAWHRPPGPRPRRPGRAARLRGRSQLRRQRHRREHQVEQAQSRLRPAD
jgi:Flp pilus assembly CpaF family ATPase